MRAPATDPVLQRLTGLEVHDIELCLLRHALVELGTVAEWEQNLEQDEHRGRDDGLSRLSKSAGLRRSKTPWPTNCKIHAVAWMAMHTRMQFTPRACEPSMTK